MLNWDDIKDFLADTKKIQEKANLECKAAANSLPKDFWKSLVPFRIHKVDLFYLVLLKKRRRILYYRCKRRSQNCR